MFAAGSGKGDTASGAESAIAVEARQSNKPEVKAATDPKVGSIVEAAVPLGGRVRDAVVEFHFSRSGIQQTLRAAERRLVIIALLGGLIMYLAILPLLARLARRVPLPVDPARRAALAELEAALAQRQFILHYQPKVDIQSGGIVGVEALVRWNHPQRGVLAPGKFLPLIESSPALLSGLTSCVLEGAIRDCARWQRNGCELPVAVNVTPSTLLDQPLAPLVRESLSRHGLDPRMLTLELTESALMAPQEDVTEDLHALRALGVGLSIDDFGTGSSSLARLRSLPVDELKVDRSFIAGISSDERDLGIAHHIIQLGLDLGLCVVAEGVEDEPTLRLLEAIGCEVAQGFHLALPMPEEQLRLWLEGRETCSRRHPVRLPWPAERAKEASASVPT